MIERLNSSSMEAWKRLRHLPHALFLDSARVDPDRGRWSLFMADPAEVLCGKGNRIQWRKKDGFLNFEAEPWETVDFFLSQFFPTSAATENDLPAAAGAGLVGGYFGYELGHALEKLPSPKEPVLEHPDFWLAYYDVVLVFDHLENRGYLVSSGRDGRCAGTAGRAKYRRDQFLDELETDAVEFPYSLCGPSEWKALVSKERYGERLDRIQSYIRAGDIYQANLTYPFFTENTGNPALMYEELRRLNPAPYAAYLDGGEFQILSSSPEEFLKIQGREAQTRPIKGTCPRLGDVPSDWKRAAELLISAKNRAELLMITDLLRNDIGRIAEFGSVRVPELVKCEEYAAVYHLVSTVTARLREGIAPWEVMMACFPGGSITGAPKLRAQQIIHECESHARGVYTGSMGYFGSGKSHWNIAIRTMVCAEGCATFSVGGAITSDSNKEDEYKETLDKARPLLKMFSEQGGFTAEKENQYARIF